MYLEYGYSIHCLFWSTIKLNFREQSFNKGISGMTGAYCFARKLSFPAIEHPQRVHPLTMSTQKSEHNGCWSKIRWKQWNFVGQNGSALQNA